MNRKFTGLSGTAVLLESLEPQFYWTPWNRSFTGLSGTAVLLDTLETAVLLDSHEPQIYWTLWNRSFTGISGTTVLLDSLKSQFYWTLWNRSFTGHSGNRSFTGLSWTANLLDSLEPQFYWNLWNRSFTGLSGITVLLDSLESLFYGLSGTTVLLDSLESQFYWTLWNHQFYWTLWNYSFIWISGTAVKEHSIWFQENSDCSGSSEPKVNAHTLLLVFGCMQQIVSNTEDTGSPEYISESHAGSVFESCQQSVQTAHALHRHGNGGYQQCFPARTSFLSKAWDTFRAGAYETNTCLLISITLFIIGYYFDVHFCLLDTHTVIEFWRGLVSRSWFSIPSHKQGPEVPMSSLAASPRNILSSREPDDNTCSSYTRFREALKKQREWGYCKLQDKCFSSFTQGKDLSTLMQCENARQIAPECCFYTER